jgi:multidrug efflux pump
MGGMVATTIFGIFLIPMLYLLVRRNVSRKQPVAAGHLDEADPLKAKPDDTEPGPDEEPV